MPSARRQRRNSGTNGFALCESLAELKDRPVDEVMVEVPIDGIDEMIACLGSDIWECGVDGCTARAVIDVTNDKEARVKAAELLRSLPCLRASVSLEETTQQVI